MVMTKTAKASPKRRANELRTILEARRRDLAQDVQGRIRDARAENANQRQAVDQGDVSELDTQDEIEFALLQAAEHERRVAQGTASVVLFDS